MPPHRLAFGRRLSGACALLLVLFAGARAVPTESQSLSRVTPPSAEFGFDIGDDYELATYTQFEAYWTRLARESDRMQLVEIGKTEEGRSQWMAIVSAPENLQRLDHYRDISRRLALAEGLTEAQAEALAAEGRAVVWIDGGLHANEVLGAQQLLETVYQLVSRDDGETRRFLRDVIVLAVHANPDGHALVADWYLREPDPLRRTLAGVPRAYQKYVGHDNNRDFYLASQAETINMNRVLYREWFPQIVYDHHQTSPPGTVMFAPPFRDPFNYVFDPLIPVSIDLVGAAMHARFASERKPGVTMRRGSSYSTWWNGGLRTTAYFHNQIGLLTETTGSPTPMEIPYVAERLVPSADLPNPIAPQPWRFRQSIEYSVTANRAVLDVASRYREALLLGAYRMGRNAIERGSRDSWTVVPRRAGDAAAARTTATRDPALRDARAYVLRADQPDFLTAVKFADALVKAGVVVHRATMPFVAAGTSYPAGSLVVKTAQAFRPHVLDMFEPQHHPDDIPYPGAPPTPPYDSAGWTLAFQMGIRFDRLLEGVEGPFEPLERAVPPPGRVVEIADAAGYLVSHHQNDAFVAVNRLLAAGARVFWPRDRRLGDTPGGAMYVPATAAAQRVMAEAARDLGLTFTAVPAPPAGAALEIHRPRVALWDRYGGSSPSGWTRWLLERYEFPFEVVYARGLDAGGLRDRFDAIVLTDEAVLDPPRGDGAPPPDRVPVEYRDTVGVLTSSRTLPALRAFVEQGGTLLAIGRSTAIAGALGLPVTSALVDRANPSRALRPEQFFVPGSILRVRVDSGTPLGYGFEREVDVFFDNSPVFRLDRGAPPGARTVAWFDSAAPLRSGWAWGQQHLEGGLAAIEVPLGRGRVLLYGPEITFRAQSHGTFKFLFNGLFYAAASTRGEKGE